MGGETSLSEQSTLSNYETGVPVPEDQLQMIYFIFCSSDRTMQIYYSNNVFDLNCMSVRTFVDDLTRIEMAT